MHLELSAAKRFSDSSLVKVLLMGSTFLFLSLQESFEGQMTEDNIELGVCNEQGFRRLTPAEVKDYLASIIS